VPRVEHGADDVDGEEESETSNRDDESEACTTW